MKSEEAGFVKIERLLQEVGILEYRPITFANILKKKNARLDRRSSEGQYSIINHEIKMAYSNTRRGINKCKYVTDSQLKKECRMIKKQQLLEYLVGLQKKCSYLKHHQTRCAKRCATLISILQKEIGQ